MKNLTFDDQFQKTYDLLQNSDLNLFLTGKAGTGKSTLLSYFIANGSKNNIVLAPTGVAALNIKGETIHSFFKFKPGINIENAKKIAKKVKKKELYTNIDTIIIDEISMVRADLLDCIDVFLKTVIGKKKPFGGIRMIFIGDLYQLPPVVTSYEKTCFESLYQSPYFFSAKVILEEHFKLSFIELEKVYRQSDEAFIELLNAIRKNNITDEQIAIFNQNVDQNCDKKDEGYIYLTSTNDTSNKINSLKLSQLEGESYKFNAEIDGDFDTKLAPTDPNLELKIGAQVMFLTNHPKGLWVNGTVGKIITIFDEELLVELENGNLVEVENHHWILYKYNFDETSKKMSQEDIGSFIQFPLRLAWAITIHKSQGKTFDKVIIDLEKGSFAHGQTYVALSRCRTFQNLILKRPLRKTDIKMDYKIVNFLTRFQYDLAEKKCSKLDKIDIIKKAIEKKQILDITYLKANDQKSRRSILPMHLGEKSYKNFTFQGLEAFCQERQETRVFKIERILEIHNNS